MRSSGRLYSVLLEIYYTEQLLMVVRKRLKGCVKLCLNPWIQRSPKVWMTYNLIYLLDLKIVGLGSEAFARIAGWYCEWSSCVLSGSLFYENIFYKLHIEMAWSLC